MVESYEFSATLGLLPQHWVVADDRLWMRNLAVFFDVFGAAMFGFLGPVFIGLGAGTDDGSLLTAGIATAAVGGALLLASIPACDGELARRSARA